MQVALSEASKVTLILGLITLIGVTITAIFGYLGQRASKIAAGLAATAAVKAEAVNKAVNNVRPDDELSDQTLRQLVVAHDATLKEHSVMLQTIIAYTRPGPK